MTGSCHAPLVSVYRAILDGKNDRQNVKKSEQNPDGRDIQQGGSSFAP
jgi:hypothetical protein